MLLWSIIINLNQINKIERLKMDFINYVGFDAVSTAIGLTAGKYITGALLQGNILTPIIYLFIFLSLTRVGYEGIVLKKYSEMFKHIGLMLVFIFLFAITGKAVIYNLNITKGILDTQNIGLYWKSKGFESADNTQMSVSSVPFMYILLSFPDQIAYAVSKTLISPDKIKEPIIAKEIKSDPSKLLDIAFTNYVAKAPSNSEKVDRMVGIAKCFGSDKLIDSIADDPAKAEKVKKVMKKLDSINPESVAEDYMQSGLPTGRVVTFCDRIRQGYSAEILSLANQLFSQDQKMKNFYKDVAKSIDEGAYPENLAAKVVQGMMSSEDMINAMNDVYVATRQDRNALLNALGNIISYAKLQAGNLTSTRGANENIMYRVQGTIITVMLAILPFVIALAFLPAFGYQFGLLRDYMFSFFLLKLWIPVYLLGWEFVNGRIVDKLSDVYSWLGFQKAYAIDPQTYTAIQYVIEEGSSYNETFLSMMALAIPAIMGAGIVAMLGNSMVQGVRNATKEGIATFGMVMGLANVVAGSIASFAGGLKEGLKGTTNLATKSQSIIDGVKSPEYNPISNPAKGGDLDYKGSYSTGSKTYLVFEDRTNGKHIQYEAGLNMPYTPAMREK